MRKMTYVTGQFQLCFCFALATLNFCIHKIIGIFADNLLHMLSLVFAFWYLKVHDDIDVDALVTELKPLKNIPSSFVPDTLETVRDVSKALTLL